MKIETFDEKCKCCEHEMAEVAAQSSANCYGIYFSYHCPNCGTYLNYYDSNKITDDDWIIPEFAKQQKNNIVKRK